MDMSLLAGLPPVPVIREPVSDAESASSSEAAEERDMDDRDVVIGLEEPPPDYPPDALAEELGDRPALCIRQVSRSPIGRPRN